MPHKRAHKYKSSQKRSSFSIDIIKNNIRWPIMIGAKERGKFLNSKGSRSLENAAFFEYFLNYFVKILQ